MRLLSTVLVATSLAQNSFGVDQSPVWATGQWEKSPVEIQAYQKMVTQLALEDKRNETLIDSEYKAKIAQFKKNKDRVAFTKLLILESFFWYRSVRHRFDIHLELETVEPINCYEFARGAFCVRRQEGHGFIPWNLVPKFFEQWKKDPSIKAGIIDNYGNKAIAHIPPETCVKYAEELLKDFPQRDEGILPISIYGHAKYWARTGSESSLRRMYELGRRVERHPDVDSGVKKMIAKFLKKYQLEFDKLPKKAKVP